LNVITAVINSHQAMTEPQNAADWRGIEALVREAMALVRDLTLSRDNLRERVLFIGTEFSILYTFMHSPA
jgi:hypothetical protein